VSFGGLTVNLRRLRQLAAISRRSLIAPALLLPVGGSTVGAQNMPAGPDSSALGTVDVRAFGATGDGKTDDSAAINDAIRHLRSRLERVGDFPLAPRLVFPSGIYAVGSSLDLTGLQAINMVIDGSGSVIHGRCAGQPVIDALGARWLEIRDLTIIGDSAAVPRVGLQIGVIQQQAVADNHRFVNLKVLGHFQLSCLYNRSAETTGFDHVFLWNDQPNSFCLVQDGVNHFEVHSQFVATNLPAETDASFNENEFINCDFRHGAGGVPVWLGDTARHAFIRCYSATNGGPSFVLHSGVNGHSMLDIDCHCETTGLGSVFAFAGQSKQVTIHGFSYRDHECFAGKSVFTTDGPVDTVELQNAQIEISGFADARCTLLDPRNRWALSGSYCSASRLGWNADGMFSGLLSLGKDVEFIGTVRLDPDQRPGATLGPADEGLLYRDRGLNKLLIWTGARWVDVDGGKH
jgi:hypothetical protein